MKPKLAIVTGNPLKFRELSIALSEFFDCEQRQIDGYEIQGTPEEIITHKLKKAFTEFKEPVLVDDTSVHFETLNGFPGPYIRDFFKAFTPFAMGEKFAGSRIEVVCRLGLMQGPDDIVIATGKITGDVIQPKVLNDNGREFDLFIQIDGTDRPMIEFSAEEKNKYSHRGNAIRDLVQKLKEKKHALS